MASVEGSPLAERIGVQARRAVRVVRKRRWFGGRAGGTRCLRNLTFEKKPAPLRVARSGGVRSAASPATPRRHGSWRVPSTQSSRRCRSRRYRSFHPPGRSRGAGLPPRSRRFCRGARRITRRPPRRHPSPGDGTERRRPRQARDRPRRLRRQPGYTPRSRCIASRATGRRPVHARRVGAPPRRPPPPCPGDRQGHVDGTRRSRMRAPDRLPCGRA